jgi:hypothetical protein
MRPIILWRALATAAFGQERIGGPIRVNAEVFPTRQAAEGQLKTDLLANWNTIKASLDGTCTEWLYAGYPHCAMVVWPDDVEQPWIVPGVTNVDAGQPWPNHDRAPAHWKRSTPDAALGSAPQLVLTGQVRWKVHTYGDLRGGTLPGYWVTQCMKSRNADTSDPTCRCYSRGSGPEDHDSPQWYDAPWSECGLPEGGP